MSDDSKTKWTLMFYFGSDNPLAPNVVTQLKAIKSAGFHEAVNVIAQFDPNTPNTQTHIFDVNRIEKIRNAQERLKKEEELLKKAQQKQNGQAKTGQAKASSAPDNAPTPDDYEDDDEAASKPRFHKFRSGNDPFIRNLVLDKLWGDDRADLKDEIVRKIKQDFPDVKFVLPSPTPNGKKPPKAAGEAVSNTEKEVGPKESLTELLKFCFKNYKAEHYMLFLLGHGLVVGNDVFLFDQNASEESLSLLELRDVLSKFEGGKIELVSFHSCSLSALEVACELKDSANYILGSQGPSFVGSWPYREILIRVFKDVMADKTDEDGIKMTVEKIFSYILNNSYDFQVAGYSFSLALCDLRAVDGVTGKLRELSQLMIEGLNLKDKGDTSIVDRILLAHWEAQSFWRDSYTDLYDFCFCLERRCAPVAGLSPEAVRIMEKIKTACSTVFGLLENESPASSGKTPGHQSLIVRSAFAGPEFQYSHGLSVYFPWSEHNRRFWKEEYPQYKLNVPEEPASWRKFLETYFKQTRRLSFGKEHSDTGRRRNDPTLEERLLEEITNHVDIGAAPSTLADADPTKPIGSSALEKPFGSAATGDDDCVCNIKNYPSFTRGERTVCMDFFFDF